jgi:GNAT superfamily N-acetyltransferase
MYRIAPADPAQPQAIAMQAALSATLAAITGDSGQASFDAGDVRGDGAVFLLACDGSGQPHGCGALRPLQPGVAELKRMYAAPGSQGLGGQLLAALEQQAACFGYRALWLSTRRINTRAVQFYLRHGYREIPPYGHYVGRSASICLGKELAC